MYKNTSLANLVKDFSDFRKYDRHMANICIEAADRHMELAEKLAANKLVSTKSPENHDGYETDSYDEFFCPIAMEMFRIQLKYPVIAICLFYLDQLSFGVPEEKVFDNITKLMGTKFGSHLVKDFIEFIKVSSKKSS